MTDSTAAERMRRRRVRLQQAGLSELRLYVYPEAREAVREFAERQNAKTEAVRKLSGRSLISDRLTPEQREHLISDEPDTIGRKARAASREE